MCVIKQKKTTTKVEKYKIISQKLQLIHLALVFAFLLSKNKMIKKILVGLVVFMFVLLTETSGKEG